MKKLLSFTTALLLSVNIVYGQSNAKYDGLKFGVKLKPHFARVTREKDSASISIPSAFRPSGGFFGEYTFSNAIKGQAALEYSGQGYRADQTLYSDGSYEQVLVGCHYVVLTVMPRFYPQKDQQLGFFIGPRIGWMIAANERTYEYDKTGGQTSKEETNLLIKDDSDKEIIPRISGGILLGLDYEFTNGLLLGFESYIGLTSMRNYNDLPDTKEYPLSYGVTLGYSLAKLF